MPRTNLRRANGYLASFSNNSPLVPFILGALTGGVAGYFANAGSAFVAMLTGLAGVAATIGGKFLTDFINAPRLSMTVVSIRRTLDDELERRLDQAPEILLISFLLRPTHLTLRGLRDEIARTYRRVAVMRELWRIGTESEQSGVKEEMELKKLETQADLASAWVRADRTAADQLHARFEVKIRIENSGREATALLPGARLAVFDPDRRHAILRLDLQEPAHFSSIPAHSMSVATFVSEEIGDLGLEEQSYLNEAWSRGAEAGVRLFLVGNREHISPKTFFGKGRIRARHAMK